MAMGEVSDMGIFSALILSHLKCFTVNDNIFGNLQISKFD